MLYAVLLHNLTHSLQSAQHAATLLNLSLEFCKRKLAMPAIQGFNSRFLRTSLLKVAWLPCRSGHSAMFQVKQICTKACLTGSKPLDLM